MSEAAGSSRSRHISQMIIESPTFGTRPLSATHRARSRTYAERPARPLRTRLRCPISSARRGRVHRTRPSHLNGNGTVALSWRATLRLVARRRIGDSSRRESTRVVWFDRPTRPLGSRRRVPFASNATVPHRLTSSPARDTTPSIPVSLPTQCDKSPVVAFGTDPHKPIPVPAGSSPPHGDDVAHAATPSQLH